MTIISELHISAPSAAVPLPPPRVLPLHFARLLAALRFAGTSYASIYFELAMSKSSAMGQTLTILTSRFKLGSSAFVAFVRSMQLVFGLKKSL